MIKKTKILSGVYYVEIPEVNLYIQCGAPAESVKHLIKEKFIHPVTKNGVTFESGPNAILLSDIMIQNGEFSNMSEFTILQMLYRQGTIIPNHPNNTGIKPLLIGLESQIISQMQYIYRGNYGLVSKEEIESCGVDSEFADELMKMKLKFAFGKLQSPSELIEQCIVNSVKREIRDGVFIERKSLNVFEISFKDESIEVDLNLAKDEFYESPYSLPQYKIDKEYFSVIHSGQGDGWDIDRPSMNSIISFQGRLYLIDIVPNIKYILDALSISINEIEGVFLTHTHDDHLAGITSLIRSDKKIKLFATPLVIKAMTKKLSALLEIEESEFFYLLDIKELELDSWNNVNELEVKPILSPHPVETTIFAFRTLFKDGYKSYGHFADIIDSKLLENMVAKNSDDLGISREFFEKVIADYKTPLDLKKIDIGGGMIHGNYEDFVDDKSFKIILAHNARELTKAEERVGSSSLFGINDVIIPTMQTYDFSTVYDLLRSNFPTITSDQIKTFLNFEIINFNPKEIIFKEHSILDDLYLILSGKVEKNSKRSDHNIVLKPGAIIGEKACLNNEEITSTFIAKNYVKALKIPATFFRMFVENNHLDKKINDKFFLGRDFLNTNLFEEGISYPTLNKLIDSMEKHEIKKGVFDTNPKRLYLVISGKMVRKVNHTIVEHLNEGENFGGTQSVLQIPSIYTFEAEEDTLLYSIPGDVIKDIPVARWKVLEHYEVLRQKILTIQTGSANADMFQWSSAYRVGINEMDNHHKKLFEIVNEANTCLLNNKCDRLETILDSLLEYTIYHFNAEEELMTEYDYPAIEEHKEIHKQLIAKLKGFQQQLNDHTLDKEKLAVMIKEWLLEHILKEDTKYSSMLNEKGIY